MAGVRNHEDLVAWKLCWELKERVFAFTAHGPVFTDFRFRDQIRGAACSACDTLAEGFYRYDSRDFARFCSMTRGSLGEVKCQLLHARKREYLNKAEFDEAWTLACRAQAATTNLHTYLRRCPPKP
ncbi:MAG: four helix bundle protein [Vicinamibacterales bacterium]|nr:four helix bundle protein [Vicinamibacterales bacterium]